MRKNISSLLFATAKSNVVKMLFIGVAFLVYGETWGQTKWDGGASGVGTAWGTGTNWSPDGVPGTSTDVLIDNSIVNHPTSSTLSAAMGVKSLTFSNNFNGTNTALVGNGGGTARVLTFGTGWSITDNATSGTITFQPQNGGTTNLSCTLTGTGTISVATGGSLVFSTVINESGTSGITKTGGGRLTLSGTNTYTGVTTITSGELRLNPAGNLNLSGACKFNGGTLSMTGITSGRTITFGSVDIADNSTLQLLASTNHTITFTSLGTLTANKVLTINGWTGSYLLGTTGAITNAGKVFIGNSASLTTAQLSQIRFYNGTNYFAATQLSSGEIVPTLSLVVSTIANQTTNTGFSVTVTAKNLDGTATNMTNATGISLSTNGNAGAIGGTTTGSITAGTNNVTISGVTLPSAGTGATITASYSSGDKPFPGTSNTFDVTAGSSPSLSAGALSSGFGTQCINTTSSTVPTFTITGSYLTSANVTVSGNAVYTFATTLGGSYSNPLNITQSGCSGASCYSQTVYVKFTPTAVTSYNGNITVGGGGASSVTTAVTGSCVNTGPSATSGSASSILTTSATVAGSYIAGCSSVTGYGIEWSTTGGFANGAGTAVSSTNQVAGSYTSALASLTANTTYYFHAYATDGTTLGYGSEGSFITYPTVPTSVTDGSITSSGFTVSWSQIAGTIENYEIEVHSNSSFTALVGTSYGTANNATSQAVAGLSSSTPYWYRIRSRNNSNAQVSAWVNCAASITTLAGPCLSDNFNSGYGNWTGGSGTYQNSTAGYTGNGTGYNTVNYDIITTSAVLSPSSITFYGSASGATSNFTMKVQYSTSSSGPWTDVTSIAANGSNSGAVTTSWFNFNVSLGLTGNYYLRIVMSARSGGSFYLDDVSVFCAPPVADVDVLGNSVSISDGTTATGTANFTQFASTEVGASTTRTFTITNAGTVGTINLGTVSISSGSSMFTILSQPSSSALTAGQTATFVVKFLPTNLVTQTATVSFTNDDPDATEQTYTFNVSGTGSYSQLSSIGVASGFTPPSNIAYVNYTSTNITSGNSIEAGRFTLIDGNTTDNDNVGTTLTALTFSLTNSANIQRVALYDFATSTELEEVPGAATVTFSATALATYLTTTDPGTKNFSLRVTYNTTVTDNQNYKFTITSATASGSGSGFAAADAGGAATSIVSNDNRIIVTADRLAFTVQPQDGTINVAVPSFTLSALDANGNLDVNATNTFTLTTSSGTNFSASASYTLVAGVKSITDVVYSAVKTNETITANSGFTSPNNTVTSTPSFNITNVTYTNGDYRTNPALSNATSVYFNSTALISGVQPWQVYSGGTWTNVVHNTGSPNSPEGLAVKPGTIYIISGNYCDAATGATYNNIIVNFPTTTGYFYTGNTSTGITIAAGKTFDVVKGIADFSGVFALSSTSNLIVRTDAELDLNYPSSANSTLFTRNASSVFTVENGGFVFVNGYMANIWTGTENFKIGSQFTINKWDDTQKLFNTSTTISNSTDGASLFGDLYIDLGTTGISSSWTYMFPSSGTLQLTKGNFEITSATGQNMDFNCGDITVGGDMIVNLTGSSGNLYGRDFGASGTSIFRVKGNFIKNGTRPFHLITSGVSGSSFELYIDGDLTINSDFFYMTTSGTNGLLPKIFLKGNLKLASGAYLHCTNSGSNTVTEVNFTGSGTTQTVDVVPHASNDMMNINFNVKSGAYVQTINQDFKIGTNSKVTVESGGTLDFGFTGSTPLNLTTTGSNTTFTLASGGTIKITSADASAIVSGTGTATGNVRLDTKVYDAAGIYHYIGKANQVAGTGLPTAITSGKLIMEMNTSALTLKLSASTSIATGQLGLLNGLLVLDAKNITLGATATVTGTPSVNNMVVTNSTGAFIKTFTATPSSFTYPVGDNVGTVEYSPAALTLNSTGAGNLGVIVTDGLHGNLGSPSNYLSRYWSFTNTLGTYNYNATFTYAAADVVGSLATVKAARYSGTGTTWNGISGSNATGTTLSITTAQTQLTSPLDNAFTGIDICVAGTWIGAGSDAFWNTTANWCGGVVPTSATNVDIPNVSNDPIVNSTTATCNNITLQSGATLGINSASAITVNGAFTNNGTVNVANNGNFIQATGSTLSGSGTFNVTRNGTSSATVFNYWSSPITSANLGLLGSSVYQYNPVSGTEDFTDDNPGPDPGWGAASFSVGKGYAAKGPNSSVTFSGTANNGVLSTIPVEYHTLSGAGSPFNLVGNPYPSNIDAATFLSVNTSKIFGTIYFWDDDISGGSGYSAQDYAYWNGSGHASPAGGSRVPNGTIASCQGFFVETKLGANTIEFNNSMRSSSATTFFKTEETLPQRIWLNADNGTYKNQILIAYIDGATQELDSYYDGKKLRGNQNISFYSYYNDTTILAIQGLAPLNGADPSPVPLGLYAGADGQYSIYIDSIENFSASMPINLLDADLGIVYDLRNGPYVFQAVQGEDNDRFVLFANEVVTALDEQENIHLNVYPNPNNGTFTIMINSGIEQQVKVSLLDVTGKLIFSTDKTIVEGNNFIAFENNTAGVYMLRIETKDRTYNTRMVSY